MTIRHFVLCLMLGSLLSPVTFSQTKKPLKNTDIVNMTKQGFDPSLIIKAIQTSKSDFDVSAEALFELKGAGVDQSVMEAMLSAEAAKPSAAATAAHGGAAPSSANRACNETDGCLLKESTEVPLKFASDLTSKTGGWPRLSHLNLRVPQPLRVLPAPAGSKGASVDLGFL
jgi:hypothetical protein